MCLKLSQKYFEELKMDSSLQIDDDTLAELLTEALTNTSRKANVICSSPTYVGLRKRGVLLRDYWLDEGELMSALRGTIIPVLFEGDFKGVDAIELCLTRQYRRVPLQDFKSKFPNTKIGIRGIKLQYQSHVALYSPTQMIAQNLTFQQVFESFLKLVSLSAEAFEKNGGVIESFEARQILVSLDPLPKAVMMHRGNQIVPLEGISQQTISDMALGMGEWLLRMCAEDGRQTYKYLPSQGKESNRNNITCQFMATLCLIRYAKFTGQPDHLALADRNLNYNLAQYYRIESGVGRLEHQGKAKLGATAFAALSILEHPHSDRYREIFQRLCQEIEALWQPDGSFYTFDELSESHKEQNFDPGAALLFWASFYKANRDPQILERCYKSFFYYRQWHRANRHPAFIPWHSQACALLFAEMNHPILRDFVFEMNDWLLPMQQWDNLRSIDARGRFYDPTHREYGLPNAAATGSYLQGLVDAYRLAVQNSDTARASAYELAIWRGLRNIRQLQFKDDVDMFYIAERAKVQGAVRTTVYDNTIRLDNVQQSLMAILKLCHLPEFPKQAPQPMFSFRLLKRGVDIAPVMAEITEKSAFWSYDTSRQEKLLVQEQTHNIFLRRAAKPFPPGISNARDVHDSCPTEIVHEFPVAMNRVEGFVKEIGGELGRVNIVRLAPKGRVHRHIDNGEYYRLRDRYHLVLQSQSGSWMKCGNEENVMHEGELWWFDNKQPHEAFNPSDQWRIHIIFDVLPKG
jgi:Aspartyl/Asparaginyl beta-hydroxylase